MKNLQRNLNMPLINLDNHNTTKPSPSAVKQMTPFFSQMWGNPSSPHSMGSDLLPYMENAYQSLYKLLEVDDAHSFIFTSSGAESINHTISSVYRDFASQTGKNQFITSNTDEAPSLMAITQLESLGGIRKIAKANKEGYVTADAISDMISPRTILVSLSWANGLTGVINPIEEISKVCKKHGILLHLDATHVLGKLYCNFEEIDAQYITFNGNQLHAPQGTGALCMKKKYSLSPFIAGGNEQASLRGGSTNVAGLIALGEACREAIKHREFMCTEIARLRNKFEKLLLNGIPNSIICFQNSERLPNCTTIAFPGANNDALLYLLNKRGILASIGGSHFQKISNILCASGFNKTLSHCAVSFSLSRDTTEEEIDQASNIIIETVTQLQKISQKIIN